MDSEMQREIAIDEELDGLIDKFINVYLPRHRGCSKHTILSYKTAIYQYLAWLSGDDGCIPGEGRQIGVLDFNKSQVMDWLCAIEDKGCCASTRNQRLAALRSFFAFVAEENPVYAQNYFSLGRICWKKAPSPQRDFLSEEELRAIMNSIEGNGDTSIKHYIFLCVLYESGARQHEIINMKVEDITYGRVCYIKIFGKGQKYRNAYISKSVALLIKEYCRHYNIRRGYLFTNQKGKPLSSAGVNYIIRRYADIAAEQVPSLWGKHVTAHTFRRSKATHMLQSGMNLVMIQHFLGHDSLKTTEKYLDVGIQDLVTAVNMAQTAVYATYQHWDNNYWNEVLSENRKNVAVT